MTRKYTKVEELSEIKGDDFLQIAFSFYFHNPIPIENLLILSHYFSMEIIR